MQKPTSGTLSALSDEMNYFERWQNVLTMLVLRAFSLYYLPVEEYYANLIPGFNIRVILGLSLVMLIQLVLQFFRLY